MIREKREIGFTMRKKHQQEKVKEKMPIVLACTNKS